MTIAVAPKATVHDPFSIECEQAILGCLLRNSSLVPQAMEVLDSSQFYDPLHARIYAQIVAWAIEGDRAITALTIAASLKSDPGIASLEIGADYFQALHDAAPSVPAVRDFALTIRDLSQRRDALGSLREAMQSLQETPIPVRDALRGVIQVGDEAERIASAAKFQTTYDAAAECIREAEKTSAGKPTRAVRTGITRVDNELGGLQGADYVVVAGKSGMGKSALMGGISWRAAAAGYPVIVFSLEMKRKQWVQRIITDIDFDHPDITSALHYRKFRAMGVNATGRSNGFTDGEFSRAVLASQQLKDWPWLEIHDEDGLTMAQIAARARAFQAKWKNDPRIREAQGCAADEEPIGLVEIDYLQIVGTTFRAGRNREQEVSDIARAQKALAKNLDWPVMAGSQMNEQDNSRAKDEKRPQAGDVRESKAIFHEADIMIAPYRPAWYVNQRKPDGIVGDSAWVAWNNELQACRNQFELIGVKNRMGRPFNLDLFCEIGANAVRDEEPMRRVRAQLEDDLLGRTS